MKQEKFTEMLRTEFDNYVNDLSSKEDAVRHSYWIACYCEILDFFENMDEEDWEETWEEIIGENPSPTTLEDAINCFQDFSHPEYYNLFCYEGLCDIIKAYCHMRDIKNGKR